jgi:hypothetical protein
LQKKEQRTGVQKPRFGIFSTTKPSIGYILCALLILQVLLSKPKDMEQNIPAKVIIKGIKQNGSSKQKLRLFPTDRSLNRFPQGAPPSELLYKILKMFFTEKEAGLVALLPIKPFTAKKAARIWKMNLS